MSSCLHPIAVRSKSGTYHMVRCGQCAPCRRVHASQIAMRAQHEIYTAGQAAFVTLTYAQDTIPIIDYTQRTDRVTESGKIRVEYGVTRGAPVVDGDKDGLHTLAPHNATLHYPDVQAYLQRIRDHWRDHKIDRKLRYLACGEYGDLFFRPHYHLIMFGFGLHRGERYIPCARDPNRWSTLDYKFLEDMWPYGQVLVLPALDGSCAYIGGYCAKKLNGEVARKVYGDRVPPFIHQSQGLGLEWARQNAPRLRRDFGVLRYKSVRQYGVYDTHTMVRQDLPLPRYYRDKLGFDPYAYRSHWSFEAIKRELEFKSSLPADQRNDVNQTGHNIWYLDEDERIAAHHEYDHNLLDSYKHDPTRSFPKYSF